LPANQKNLAQHELIGLKVEIVSSSDSSQVGRSGKVVDETRNMLFIENGSTGKVMKITKDGAVFEFDCDGGNGKTSLAGRDIRYRPEDRIKKSRQ